MSDRNAIDFSLEAQMLDLQAVLDTLGLERFALFGHSHGTPLAITYAVRFPERVTHLVLRMPYARGRDLRPASENLGLQPLANMSEDQWLSFTGTLAYSATSFTDRSLGKAIAHRYREAMTPKSYFALLVWRDEVDITPLLGEVHVPTLILSRRHKFRPPLEMELATAIANSRVVTLEADPNVPDRWLDAETQAVESFLGINHDETAVEAEVDTRESANSLTPRELEILALLVAGQSNREIAETLVLSERTVARHIANIYTRTGTHGRAEITAYALRHKLV
jgi:DNA-binding CsgD family transcriptional regulator